MNHIIMDTSVVRMNAKHVLEEGVFFIGFNEDKETWCKNYTDAKTYPNIQEAVEVARKLTVDNKKPRIFIYQQQGPNLSITEIKY